LLVILIIVGAVLGSLVGSYLVKSFPILSDSWIIGLKPPVALDFRVITLTLGATIDLNILGGLGIIIGILVWRRM
jgi:hypothetical protein